MTRGQRTDSVLLCGKRPTEAGGINKDGPADQWVAKIGFPSLNFALEGFHAPPGAPLHSGSTFS
jgi:hypothetical protein